MRQAYSSRTLIVHCPYHDVNTCEPRKKPHFTDGFYDSFSSGLSHDRGHTSSASFVGPQHASHDASFGSSHKTLGDVCLFTRDTTHSCSRVVLLR
jgi:hypothetical protein